MLTLEIPLEGNSFIIPHSIAISVLQTSLLINFDKSVQHIPLSAEPVQGKERYDNQPAIPVPHFMIDSGCNWFDTDDKTGAEEPGNLKDCNGTDENSAEPVLLFHLSKVIITAIEPLSAELLDPMMQSALLHRWTDDRSSHLSFRAPNRNHYILNIVVYLMIHHGPEAAAAVTKTTKISRRPRRTAAEQSFHRTNDFHVPWRIILIFPRTFMHLLSDLMMRPTNP